MKLAIVLTCLLGFGCAVAAPNPAVAQEVVYVSSTGSNLNANNCQTIASPCGSISNAILRAGLNGRVVCIDPVISSDYPSINQSIAIDCPGSTVRFFQITLSSADHWAIIDGLKMIGDPTIANTNLQIIGRGSVTLNNVHVNPALAMSIGILPNGPLSVTISNSTVASGGLGNSSSSGTSGGGIVVNPQPQGTARVTIDRSAISGNVFGIAFDGSGSTGGINATISDSVISANRQDGIVATSSPGQAPIGVFVTDSRLTNNNFGIRSIGSNVTVRVESSKIIGNVTGVAALSGGALLSAGNNYVQANATNGVFTGAVPAQ